MTTIQSKIREVRTGIRWYAAIDGISSILIILGIGIAVILALDYLPVLFGTSETPRLPRTVILVAFLIILLASFWRYLLRRFTAKLDDTSILMLIERSHPDFQDRLLTSELGKTESLPQAQLEMLNKLENEIEPVLDQVTLSTVLSMQPLIRNLCWLAIPFLLLGSYYLFMPEQAHAGISRSLFLTNIQYPRKTEIVSASYQVIRDDPSLEKFLPSPSQVLGKDQVIQLGQGTSLAFNLVARNIESAEENSRPIECHVLYRLDDGRSGKAIMNRLRKTQNKLVRFSAEGGIFEELSTSGTIWFQANDASLGPFRIRTLPLPSVALVEQSLLYPSYLVEDQTFENGQVEFVNGQRLPSETIVDFKIHFACNQLRQVKAWSSASGELIDYSVSINENTLSFSHEIASDETIGIAVEDDKGIVSKSPFWIDLGEIEDRIPQISAVPFAIGTVATRNAVIPIRVNAKDEFGIKEGAIELTYGMPAATIRIPFTWSENDQQEVKVDLRKISAIQNISVEQDLDLQPNNQKRSPSVAKVSILIWDNHPSHDPARSQEFDFELVTESRLLQSVEQQEAAIRKRLEEIFLEFSKSQLLSSAVLKQLEASDFEDRTQVETLMVEAPLFIQRIRLQTQKTNREITGLAISLDDLVKQLENNRLKIKSKQVELSAKVAQPLLEYSKTDLANFQKDLIQWSERFKQDAVNGVENRRDLALLSRSINSKHDELLKRLNSIIQQMVKFESQNELLESVRAMIKEHRSIMEATKNELEKKLFEGILD